MDNALPIKQDEVAVFYAGTENLDLAYAFAAECETRRIETLVQSCGDYINQAKILKAPLESFQRLPKIPEALLDVVDWFIYLTGTAFDNSFYQKPELQERILEVRKASKWSPPVDPRWVYRVDFNNDRKIDIKDVSYVAKYFGSGTTPIWTPS